MGSFIATVKISHIICFAAMLLAAPRLTVADTDNIEQFTEGMERFGSRLYAELVKEDYHKNIVFSPFSIQTCITMARMGATGETAREIDQALTLSDQKLEDVASNYHTLLEQYQNSSIVKIANKIYAMTGCNVQDKFNDLMTNQFYSSVESLNFAKNVESASTINSWVEDQTNNLIKDLINPSLLDATTRLVLVNAIHFKGIWKNKFAEDKTREMDFYLDETRTTKVQMMHVKGDFLYADLADLDAQALQLPYEGDDLVMLVILPKKRTGLAKLESKLKNTLLADITEQMDRTKVIVDMPKFKAEFEAELTKPLSAMGMQRMFSERAEFGNMLKSDDDLKISAIVHKAFIEVNEHGTEAAAATAAVVSMRTARLHEEPPKQFKADRPFFYALKNEDNLILFEGVLKNNS